MSECIPRLCHFERVGCAPPEDPEPETATDVADSAECKQYCDRGQSECGASCSPEIKCEIPAGQCAASTRAYLACQAQTGSYYCGSDGYSLVHNCDYDTSLCSGGGGVTGVMCSEFPDTAPSAGSCYSGNCNPVTNAGCPSGSCDLSDQGYNCFPTGTADMCTACDNQAGPFCATGSTCVGGQCARFCCTDADCGCGKCIQQNAGGELLSVCLD